MTSARRLTWLCHGAMMSLALGLNLLPVFLSRIGEGFDGRGRLSGEQLGRLGAIVFLGLVIGIFLAGWLADRYGAKLFAVAGNALTGVGLAASAAAPGYDALCLALLLLGIAAGMLDMVLSPVVAALHPERRAAAMNWLHSFYCVGAVFAIAVATVSLAMGLGWRAVCLLLVPLPAALTYAFSRARLPAPAGGGDPSPLGVLLARPWFRGALIAIFLGGATELGIAQWLPVYARRELGFPEWVGGTSLIFFSVAMALGRMAIGALGDSAKPTTLLAWGCGVSTVLFVVAAFSPDPRAALAACVAVGFTGSALWPTMLAVAANRYPDGGSAMYAALAALGNAGGVFMPWLIGIAADGPGLRWGIARSAVAPLLMLPLVLALGRRPASSRG